MSHNTIKVNNQTPDQHGEITLNLSNIITVNSPQVGELLQKASTDWQTSKLEANLNGLLNYYDNAGLGRDYYYYDAGDVYDMRKVDNEFNVQEFVMITSSGSYVSRASANSSWVMAFNVKATDYPSGSVILFRARISPYRHSNSNCTAQWFTGEPTQDITNSTAIGNKAFSDMQYGGTAFGLLKCTGSDIKVMIRITAVTGQIAQQTGYGSRTQIIVAKQLA
tara:strand:- start:226 stop:891 length:666 start_codon:yes stop_codon:yes gene_type:complete